MQVVVGRIAKTHGVHGAVAVDVRTDSPDTRFVRASKVTAHPRQAQPQDLTVAAVRAQGDRLLVRFDEIGTRDGAEPLRGALLFADTAELPPIDDPDEFYDHQLEGLRAELADGTAVGVVSDVVHAPGGDLLAVQRDDGAVLVPFVHAIVPLVDVAAGTVVLDPPEGLLDT